MEAKKINNAKKNNVKEINECTKIGDVAMVHGFKSTMVNVERKVFETIAWTWDYDSDCYPCSTKKEALEAAKELYSNPKEHVIKARFSICLKSDMECWEIDHEVPLDTKIGAAPIDEDDTDEEDTTTEENANNGLIEATIWSNINDLKSSMDSVLHLAYEMAYEWNWSFDDAKKHLLSEADDILDTYVEGLREVDDELAGKVENCIKSIVEEVKPFNHDDFDWDEFKDYDIEDLAEEVKALIAKHDAENK